MPGGTTAIDALTAAFAGLRRALDDNDAARILSATRTVRDATDAVRAHGAWRIDPELRARVDALAPMIEAARIRVNMSSDNVRQRLAMLADRGGDVVRSTYRR